MNTLNVPAMSEEHLQRAADTLNNGPVFLDAEVVQLSTASPAKTLLITQDFGKTQLSIGFKRHNGENFLAVRYASEVVLRYVGNDNTLPDKVLETPVWKTPLRRQLRAVHKRGEQLQKAYEYILKIVLPDAKEAFYDDASDYQDDEPTDFGDASNYDEGLVRRIEEKVNVTDTIDLSAVARTDLENAIVRIEQNLPQAKAFVTAGGRTFCAYVQTDQTDKTRSYVFTFTLLFLTKQAELAIRVGSEAVLDKKFPLDKTPTKIPNIVPFFQNKERIAACEILKKHLPEIQGIYDNFLGTFRAQSKEDFYDDASDYQDDEPTDFGDASNYDESLVRRIKEVLE